jgi:hypothetical protein
MDDLISIIALVLYIAAILGVSMAITWVVIKISPSESAKELEEKAESSKA